MSVSSPGGRASRGAAAVLAVLMIAASAASLLRAADDERLARRAESTLATVPDAGALPPGPSDSAAAAAASSAKDLRPARELLRDLVRRRPGAFLTRWLLARSSAADDLRSLELARRAAPGLDLPNEELARATLAAWARLSPADRSAGRAAVRRAFESAAPAGRLYPTARAAIGEEASALLPDSAGPLAAAARSVAAASGAPVSEVADLFARADRAEARALESDLAALSRARNGGEGRLLAACARWAESHPDAAAGSDASRAAAAVVLAAWPPDEGAGDWETSARGRLARAFLAAGGAGVSPPALARALTDLRGVPAPVLARARLLTGDVAAAEDVASGSASGSEDPSAWTPYFVALSRTALARGNRALAVAALARVPAEAAEDCEVLLARADVARAASDTAGLAAAKDRLERLRSDLVQSPEWSTRGDLALCSDPAWSRGRTLRARLTAPAPTLVAWSLPPRSGRAIVVPDGTDLAVPLDGLAGSQAFSVRVLAGGPGLVREPPRLEGASQ